MSFIKKNAVALSLVAGGALVLLLGIAGMFYDYLFSGEMMEFYFEVEACLGIALILRLVVFFAACIGVVVGGLTLFGFIKSEKLNKLLLTILAAAFVLMIIFFLIPGASIDWTFWVIGVLLILITAFAFTKDKLLKK